MCKPSGFYRTWDQATEGRGSDSVRDGHGGKANKSINIDKGCMCIYIYIHVHTEYVRIWREVNRYIHLHIHTWGYTHVACM